MDSNHYELIIHVYVARRPLSGLAKTSAEKSGIQIGLIAHSAILVKCQGSSDTREDQTAIKYFLIEYLDDSKVHITEVDEEDISEDKFNCQGYNWTKQIKGKALKQKRTVAEVAIMMKFLMDLDGQYNWITNCCHVAQESTRQYYGWAQGDPLDYQQEVNKKLSKIKK